MRRRVLNHSFPTADISHPSNGKFDATPANSALSVIELMAKGIGVDLDVEPIDPPRRMSTGGKIIAHRTKRRN